MNGDEGPRVMTTDQAQANRVATYNGESHSYPMKAAGDAFPSDLLLTTTSRWPTQLPEATIRYVLDRSLPALIQPGEWRHASRRPGASEASIIIVTFNGLVFTRLCMESLLANSGQIDYEVIVVDNGSTDGTVPYLQALAGQYPRVRVVLNDRNVGFAAATNQGLSAASGKVLVLLNNDTIVPVGWLDRLIEGLGQPEIGLLGPVTNRSGNEAEIEVPYRTYGELARFAEEHYNQYSGRKFDIQVLTMFCLAMRRDAYEAIGPLDEQFGLGMFEDDDYSIRARNASYRVVCAEDLFVHHFGQATIGRLTAAGEYGTLFHGNRRKLEAKWNVSWRTHKHRERPAYLQLAERVRELVSAILPIDSTVIVVSKGDDNLLDLDGRPSWHFPQDLTGAFSGYYPADSEAAIAHLESLRARGGQFLLFPSTAAWWLEHYIGLREHLRSHYRLLVDWKDTCLIFDLRERANDD